MDEVVRAMHARSGLLEAVQGSTVSLQQAGEATLAFLRQHIPASRHRAAVWQLHRYRPPLPRRVAPAKSTPTCTTGRSMCRRSKNWPGAGIPRSSTTHRRRPGAHRALGDILESIGELRYYRDTIFRGQ